MNLNETLFLIFLLGQLAFIIYCFVKRDKIDTNFNTTADTLAQHIKKLSDDFDTHKVFTIHKILSLEARLKTPPADWKDEIIIDKDNKWGGGEINTREWTNITDLIKEKYPAQYNVKLTKSGKPDKRYKNNK